MTVLCFYSLAGQSPMIQSTMSQVISINVAELTLKQNRNLATAQYHVRSVTAADRGKNMFSRLPLLNQQQEQILHLLYFHPYGKCLPTFPGNLLNCGSPLSCLKLVHLLCRQSAGNRRHSAEQPAWVMRAQDRWDVLSVLQYNPLLSKLLGNYYYLRNYYQL